MSILNPKVTGRISVALGVLFVVVALVIGFRQGDHDPDIDQTLFRREVASVRNGVDYYEAAREALINKSGEPPSSVRAIRPPLLYELEALIPEDAQRWVVVIALVAIVFSVRSLGRGGSSVGRLWAVCLAGIWVMAITPVAYLHAEVWGVAALLIGLVAMRDRRVAIAAICFGLAAMIREPFVFTFVLGIWQHRLARSWYLAFVAVVGMYTFHIYSAWQQLDPTGGQPRLGITRDQVLAALSPGAGWLATVIGVLGLALGTLGMLRLTARSDATANLALIHVAVFVVATFLFGKTYWAVMFAPIALAYLPFALPLKDLQGEVRNLRFASVLSLWK